MNALGYYWDKFGIFAVAAVALILSSTILSPANAEGRPPVKSALVSVLGEGGRIIAHIDGQPVEIFVTVPAKQKPGMVMDGQVILELHKSLPMDRMLVKDGIVTPIAQNTNALVECQAFATGFEYKALLVRVIDQSVRIGNTPSIQEFAIDVHGTVAVRVAGTEQFQIFGKYTRF